jgi:hypothetical protein
MKLETTKDYQTFLEAHYKDELETLNGQGMTLSFQKLDGSCPLLQLSPPTDKKVPWGHFPIPKFNGDEQDKLYKEQLENLEAQGLKVTCYESTIFPSLPLTQEAYNLSRPNGLFAYRLRGDDEAAAHTCIREMLDRVPSMVKAYTALELVEDGIDLYQDQGRFIGVQGFESSYEDESRMMYFGVFYHPTRYPDYQTITLPQGMTIESHFIEEAALVRPYSSVGLLENLANTSMKLVEVAIAENGLDTFVTYEAGADDERVTEVTVMLRPNCIYFDWKEGRFDDYSVRHAYTYPAGFHPLALPIALETGANPALLVKDPSNIEAVLVKHHITMEMLPLYQELDRTPKEILDMAMVQSSGPITLESYAVDFSEPHEL